MLKSCPSYAETIQNFPTLCIIIKKTINYLAQDRKQGKINNGEQMALMHISARIAAHTNIFCAYREVSQSECKQRLGNNAH